MFGNPLPQNTDKMFSPSADLFLRHWVPCVSKRSRKGWMHWKWSFLHTNPTALGAGVKTLAAQWWKSNFLIYIYSTGNSTLNSIRDCQNADELGVPSRLQLFTLLWGVRPLHKEEKEIPSLTGCDMGSAWPLGECAVSVCSRTIFNHRFVPWLLSGWAINWQGRACGGLTLLPFTLLPTFATFSQVCVGSSCLAGSAAACQDSSKCHPDHFSLHHTWAHHRARFQKYVFACWYKYKSAVSVPLDHCECSLAETDMNFKQIPKMGQINKFFFAMRMQSTEVAGNEMGKIIHSVFFEEKMCLDSGLPCTQIIQVRTRLVPPILPFKNDLFCWN